MRTFSTWKTTGSGRDRKDILHAVREKQTKQAEQLLSEYEESLEDDENIRRQFYLVMLADIRKKAEGQELFVRKCYREALALTVPEADTVWAKQRPLSILEINLLLENWHMRTEWIPS